MTHDERYTGQIAAGNTESPKEESLINKTNFPYINKFCQSQGRYRIPDQKLLLRCLQGGVVLTDQHNNGVLRVDMAIASLWPLLSHLFNDDIFPSRLAAALQLLLASGFRDETGDDLVKELGRELAQALDGLESSLARESVPDTTTIAEAVPDRHKT